MTEKMNPLKKLLSFFTKNQSYHTLNKTGFAPLLMITKEPDDMNTKQYQAIYEAIADLENDPHVPVDKIEKLKLSLKNLKNKTSIKIQSGEIMK